MEKRAILAFGLSALLLFAYVWVQEQFFTPPPPPKTSESVPSRPAPPPPATQSPAAPTAPAPTTAPAPEPADTPAAPRPPQRTARVDTPLYRAVVSSEGGKLQDWTLDYRGDRPMVVVGEFGLGGLTAGSPDAKGLEPVAFTVKPEQLQLETRQKGDVVLEGVEDGLHVRQSMTFDATRYTIGVKLEVRNPGRVPRPVAVSLPWVTRDAWPDATEKYMGQRPTEVVWSSGGRVGRLEDLTSVTPQEFTGEWIGMGSVWYLAALLPKSGDFRLAMQHDRPAGAKDGAPGRVTVAARATPTIAPGQTWQGDVLLYVGPKEYERLRALGLEAALNFGGFPIPRSYGGLPMEWVGVPILRLLQWVYGLVGNYGIAIIILTVISKVLFYPLTVKSMRSMKAMQALSPQINALRTKYKSDPQRVQRETLELYRKYKVNPMGGCLPMVAQVPVFYALYLALSVSVELQNASFVCFGRLFGVDLWICDLASQDPTYILPVLMGVTMFVQQKMAPAVGDPRQAKMMLLMPFVFTIMFVNLPAGLVLYWTVSNILQILQQWYMDRPHGRSATREAKDASGA
ncbi:MAG: membrane protein insertase YidC [Candidatus Rokubacteria bacterium]|nr:membrane protein insertase YidC [Candidatus Rokubacteria bacterium]